MRRSDFLAMADKLAGAGGAITGAIYQKGQQEEAKKAMDKYMDNDALKGYLAMMPIDYQPKFLASVAQQMDQGISAAEAGGAAFSNLWPELRRALPGKERTTGTPLKAATNPSPTAPIPPAVPNLDFLGMAKNLLPQRTEYVTKP